MRLNLEPVRVGALTSDSSVAGADDVLINTQLQFGVMGDAREAEPFNGLSANPKTVETVTVTAAHSHTSMNRGVNENRRGMVQSHA